MSSELIDAQLLANIQQQLLEKVDFIDASFGSAKRLFFYRDAEGFCAAKGFLEGLPDKALASYVQLFRMRCGGHQLRGERHRPWTEAGCERLYEFKDNPSQTRLIHTVEVGNLDVLLYGFGGKKENKVDTSHVKAAQRLRDEYRKRRTEIEELWKRRRRT